MSIFSRLFQGQIAQKASAAAHLLMTNTPAAIWTPRNYKSFAVEGYQKNVVAYRAITSVAVAVGSVEWQAYKGDKLLDTSPALDLLNDPNPMQSRVELIQSMVGYLMISGNNYLEKVEVGGVPKELYALRPDRMKIRPSPNGIPAGFTMTVGQRDFTWDVDPHTLDSPILHTKLFNPLDDWYGMSPVEAGAYGIDQHNEAMKWIHSLLQNSARPSGALVTKSEEYLPDQQFNKLKAQIEEQYTGAANAGRPMLLEGGLDWKAMGFSPHDMAIIETKYSAARDVSLAFGVPPQLLGIPGDNTYSNYSEARLAFWEDTIIPLFSHLAGDLNQWFQMTDAWGDVELRPDFNSVPAIADKNKSLWAMADASKELTINEKREIKGYEAVPDGDVIVVQSTFISLADMAPPTWLVPDDSNLVTVDEGNLDDATEMSPDDEGDDEGDDKATRKALALIAGYETASR